MSNTKQTSISSRKGLFYVALLCGAGVLLNLAGSRLANGLGLPIFLDCLGTALAAVVGGYLPGIVVGLLTNFINSVFDPTSVYYGTLNVLIAVIVAYAARKGWLKRLPAILGTILVLALVSGTLGSVLTWFLYGFSPEGVSSALVHRFYADGMEEFPAQLLGDFLTDLMDKAIVMALALLLVRLMPQHTKDLLRFDSWQQAPLSPEAVAAAKQSTCRHISLRAKILTLITVASLAIALVATSISYILYRNYSIEVHTQLGQGVASLAVSVINADRVEEYLTQGEAAEGYLETERLLYSVRESSPDIEYVYVYRILEDGCHVVFDLDTDEVQGDDPGAVIPFDPTFLPYLPDLLAGKPIEPIISDDSFGWLLTVYQPVYDSQGNCVCYAAADVSMNQLTTNSHGFLAKQVSLFLGFFILVLSAGLWLAEYNITLPINTMAQATGAFAYNSDEALEESVERIRALEIHTGDEIENLYHAIAKTTGDTVRYIADVREKNEVIANMQNGLIMVLADMVESRDKNTGDHIRKTAAYVRIIMEQLLTDHIYPEQMTEEFINDVAHSAPLHDVGKIKISDTILNKPARLTDEEFAIMKTHTLEGGKIIDQAINIVPDSGYLAEAKNLAMHHHERWDGKGYPSGLAGEDIPLSARIMAVADVFDALVSKRSYKEGFPFEKAMDIIREGSGTQFDPQIAAAFLRAEDKVRRVADSNAKLYF